MIVSTLYRLGAIHDRQLFGDLFNTMGYTVRGAEIGTHRGRFSRAILNRWKTGELYCIDPWSIPRGYEDQAAKLPEKGQTRSMDMMAALKILERYEARTHMLGVTSAQALEILSSSRKMDFVYIDGDHSEEAVRFDLWQWWDRIRSGGMIAGHDWLCPGEKDDGWGKGIQPVVYNFASCRGLPVYLVPDPDNGPWSYYIIKP